MSLNAKHHVNISEHVDGDTFKAADGKRRILEPTTEAKLVQQWFCSPGSFVGGHGH